MTSMLLKLSVPGARRDGGPQPHPVYGLQLQQQGILGEVPAEGIATLDWMDERVVLSDGTTVHLRRPRLQVRNLAFGPLGEKTMTSARVAPPLAGLGMLETVADSTLIALAERDAGEGIHGRVNRVPAAAGTGTIAGRFGLKASRATIREQIADALHEDLGVTSTLHPDENCPPAQASCRLRPIAKRPEITTTQLDDLTMHIRMLPPPAARVSPATGVRRGRAIFVDLQCAACHLPTIDGLPVSAYTDLLLHDLGAGLADGRPEFDAGPRDWRTAPLWGLGRAVAEGARLLHDGRARTMQEAILWHGGEALGARQSYAALPRSDRDALIRFLGSL